MTVAFFRKRPLRRHLSLRRRHLGLNSKLIAELKSLTEIAIDIAEVYNTVKGNADKTKANKLFYCLLAVVDAIDKIESVPVQLNLPLPKVVVQHRKRFIDDFDDSEILLYFRFNSKEQLHRLMAGFILPDILKSSSGHVYYTETMLLVTLYRFHRPTTLNDMCFSHVFGFDYNDVGKIVNTFVRYLIPRWSYLVEDNRDYWTPYLSKFSEDIRQKLSSMGCEFVEGTFRVFGFIDNTIISTTRPGGGAKHPGPGSRRHSKIIQQSFYNGWKKSHGIKYQTVDLPNGMHYQVWGPVSCRHNDNYCLYHSEILRQIEESQNNQLKKYVIYGDSAYHPEEYILVVP